MRIVHLAPRLSARGGADVHLLSIVHGLAPHQQSMVVGRADGTATVACDVLEQRCLGARRGGDMELLAQRVLSGAPDIVHLHNVVNPDVLEAATQWPALLTIQDHRFFCPGQGKLTAAGEVCSHAMSRAQCGPCFHDEHYFAEVLGLTERRLRAARRLPITVLSRYMKRELVAAGCEPARVWVNAPFVFDLPSPAHHHVASREVPDLPEHGYVLFVGRLVRAKGVFEAAEAWRRSGVEQPLIYAGTGSSRRELEADGHRVLGWQSREQLAALYRHAKVLVMPSRWQEPFGIVGLEALAHGVPVAAWRSGGVSEWHPGGAGLVSWGDVQGLANAITVLTQEQPAPAYPSGFEPSVLLAQLQRIYGDLFPSPSR